LDRFDDMTANSSHACASGPVRAFEGERLPFGVDEVVACLGYADPGWLTRHRTGAADGAEARIAWLAAQGVLSIKQASTVRTALESRCPPMADVLRWMGVRPNHVRAAVLRTETTGESLADVMSDFGFLSPERVAQAISLQSMRYPYLSRQVSESLDLRDVRADALQVARCGHHVPIAYDEARCRMTVAVSHPDHIVAATNAYYRYKPDFVIAAPRTIRQIYERNFSRTEQELADLEASLLRAGSADGTALERPDALRDYIVLLLRHACHARASDIHLHRTADVGVIKLTVDAAGTLFRVLPESLYERLVTRFVHYARVREDGLRGDGLRDGALEFAEGDLGNDRELAERFAFRIELGTAKSGRTAVIRILDREADSADFESLGFADDDRRILRRYTDSASGLVLITGPTGSGKTTTLYAMLKEIDPETHSIQSIENPVEYRHGLWMQYEMRRTVGSEGLEWAKWLKGLLRNAPKVILMGEVRDGDTARTLLDGANTGHLVFTTLHTNSAASAIHRLRRLGVGQDELADALLGVVAQRLVRRVCRRCAVPERRGEVLAEVAASCASGPDGELEVLAASDEGCDRCGGMGYLGRAMIYELLDASPGVRESIELGEPASRLSRIGIPPGKSLWDCGLHLVARGLTTYDEVVSAAWREGRRSA